MKKLIAVSAIILSSFFGYNTVYTAETNLKNNENEANIETSVENYIYVKVYENGAIWVYVYTQDGIFVAKYEDS